MLEPTFHLSEDADHLLAAMQGTRADLDDESIAVRVDERHFGIRHDRGSGDLASEDVLRVPPVLGRHHRRELFAPNVAYELHRGRVDPTDHAGSIDDVARDVDALEHALDVTPHSPETGHAFECAPRHAPGQAGEGLRTASG
jgi:hypothetical protein